MHKILKQIWFFLILLLGAVYLLSGHVIGYFVEPYLESKLSRLFGLEVEVEGLYAHPYPGYVEVKRLVFYNPDEYDYGALLDVREGMKFDIDFIALAYKRLIVQKVTLRSPVFFMDRRRFEKEETSRSNSGTWIRYIQKVTYREEKPKVRWSVWIQETEIQNGKFILQYEDKQRQKREFVFRQLEGVWENFYWPVQEPKKLLQKLEMKGLLGEARQAPVFVKGRTNFSTNPISFNLTGEVRGALITDYPMFWGELPIEFQQGAADLKSQFLCRLGELEAKNQLTLQSIKVVTGAHPVEKVWGVPFKASIDFLQNQKKIELEIPVKGQLTNPDFQYHRAFSKAFQKSLTEKVQKGVIQLGDSASKFAVQAQDFVLEAPAKVAGGLDLIKGVLQKESVKKNE